MRYSRIGAGRYRKALRSRSVGAAVLIAVIAATLLTTLVVGAAAANKKASHGNRGNRSQHTTAHLMVKGKGTKNGGLPFTG